MKNVTEAMAAMIEELTTHTMNKKIDRFSINANNREISMSIFSGNYSLSKLFLVNIISSWTFPSQFMKIEVNKIVNRI